MTDIELLKTSLKSAMAVYQNVLDNETDCITNIATKLGDILEAGGTIYLCGNGGSAADAQHIAAEFVGRFLHDEQILLLEHLRQYEPDYLLRQAQLH